MAGPRDHFRCCDSPLVDASWDLDHCSGLDFDLEHCGRCDRYTMTLWSPHGAEGPSTHTVEVSAEDAKLFLALQEHRRIGVSLLESGRREEAERFFGDHWREHGRVLDAWLERQGFDWA